MTTFIWRTIARMATPSFTLSSPAATKSRRERGRYGLVTCVWEVSDHGKITESLCRPAVVGTRSRLIRGSGSAGHVRCTASDDSCSPAHPGVTCLERVCGGAAPDAPERGSDQSRGTRSDQPTSCCGSRGSASLPAHRRSPNQIIKPTGLFAETLSMRLQSRTILSN
jgi:hypothetical protein